MRSHSRNGRTGGVSRVGGLSSLMQTGGSQAVQRLALLNEIARLLASFETVAQTFEEVVTVLSQAMPLASAILIEDLDAVGRVTHWPPSGQTMAEAAEARGHAETAFAYLIGNASPDNVSHAGVTLRPGQAVSAPGSAGSLRFIVLPLVVADRPAFGVLQVEGTLFDKQDLLFIGAVASQLAVALDRDRAWRLDVGRRRLAEDTELTLRSQADALVAGDRQRSRFLLVLADELRATLGTLREIQQAFRAQSGNERSDRAIRLLGGQIQQTAQLIDDLHGLSNLTHEVVQVSRHRVEIGAILAHSAKEGTARLSARGQSLTVSLPDSLAWLDADPVRIEQVFDVLIDKASSLASPGGRIWLTGRLINGMLQVTLRDDGAGNVAAILPRIFDLFNPSGRDVDQADATSGAGLKQMRRIVELHGGEAMASSSGFGQGTEFEVRLPLGAAFVPELRAERRSS